MCTLDVRVIATRAVADHGAVSHCILMWPDLQAASSNITDQNELPRAVKVCAWPGTGLDVTVIDQMNTQRPEKRRRRFMSNFRSPCFRVTDADESQP
jgi:hypothetical protein